MIARLTGADLPLCRRILQGKPHLWAAFFCGLRSIDPTAFSAWLSRSESGSVLLFCCYDQYFAAWSGAPDLSESALFLNMLPDLSSLSGEEEQIRLLCPLLSETFREQSAWQLALPADGFTPRPPQNEIPRPTESMEALHAVHTLLTGDGGFDLPSFDAYYRSRFYIRKAGLGRTWTLGDPKAPDSTVSTLYETRRLAYLGAVATRTACRGRGLAGALVSRVCEQLRAEGKQPLISYTSPSAGRIYRSLGFTDCGIRLSLFFTD